MEPVSPHLYSLPSAARARRSTQSLNSVLSSTSSSVPAVSSPLASPILRAATRTPPSPILLSRTSAPVGRITVPPSSTRRVAQSNAAAASPPLTPPPVTYDVGKWALLSIVRDVVAPSAARSRMLTVTLLHRPSEALFAWPLQTDPSAPAVGPGKVFITPRSPAPEDAPTQAVTSESLRVLGSVLGAWMRSRRRASLAGYTAASSSATEEEEEQRETAAIATELGLIQLTAQQRRTALVRQHVPSEELPDPVSPGQRSAMSDGGVQVLFSTQPMLARRASLDLFSTSQAASPSRPRIARNDTVSSIERHEDSSSSTASSKSPKSCKSTLSAMRLLKFGSTKRSPPSSRSNSASSSPTASRRTSVSSAASSVPTIEITEAALSPIEPSSAFWAPDTVRRYESPISYADASAPPTKSGEHLTSTASVVAPTDLGSPLARWGSTETINPA